MTVSVTIYTDELCEMSQEQFLFVCLFVFDTCQVPVDTSDLATPTGFLLDFSSLTMTALFFTSSDVQLPWDR